MVKLGRRKSVLAKQKLKKSRLQKIMRLGRYSLPILAIIGGIFTLSKAKPLWQKTFFSHPVTWQIDIRASGNDPISEKSKDLITHTAKTLLKDGDSESLEALTLAIRHLDVYEDVHVIKIRPGLVSIFVKERSPFFCLISDKDKIKYVTRTGDIYGTTDAPDAPPCSIVLSGIKEAKLTPDLLRKTLLEAGDLLELGSTAGFTFTKMLFNPYRGFTVWLKEGGTEVAMGRLPFHDKFPKLKEILSNVANKSEIAVRVELDFNGKAFIKTQKM